MPNWRTYAKAIAAGVLAYTGSVLASLALVASDGINLGELLAALAAPLLPGVGAAVGTYKVPNAPKGQPHA